MKCEEKLSLLKVIYLGTIEPLSLLTVIALTTRYFHCLEKVTSKLILGPSSLPIVIAIGTLESLSLLIVIALRRQ